jgi:hypothetical protein
VPLLEEDRFIRDAKSAILIWKLSLRNTRNALNFEGFFELIADDFVSMEELERFALRLPPARSHSEMEWSDYLVERIQQVRERENRPIIRAHIGIAAETIEPTIKAIEKLADAGAFEIVSLAP